MKQRRKKYRSILSWKVFPTVGMALLLLLLTSMNFFLYAGDKETVMTCMSNSGGDEESPESSNPCSPAGPDEKSPNKPVSINEEYIHEGPEVENPFWVNPLFEHKIHEAEKLQIVHSECITPPPKA